MANGYRLRYTPRKSKAASSTLNQVYADPILNDIFKRENEYLHKEFIDIVKHNARLSDNSVMGFYYKGTSYTATSLKDVRGHIKPLHLTLVDRFNIYLSDQKTMKADALKIRNGFSKFMRKCPTSQEFRDLLPESLIQSLDCLNSLKRQQPEAWMFKDGSPEKEEYEETVNLAIYYIGRRLLR